jgi:2-keto-4-pentenoate hydratase
MNAPVEPRLTAALQVQLRAMRAALDGEAQRVGWKVGAGDRERIGEGPVVGHLTSATVLEPGTAYRPTGVVALHADAEVFLELGRDVSAGDDMRAAISGYGAALELVDLGPPDGADAIVATNIFHRAVAFGPVQPALPHGELEGALIINGQLRAAAPAARDHAAILRAIARLLDAVGEGLRTGDRIITGSVVQLPLAAGDDVRADFGPLGAVGARIY